MKATPIHESDATHFGLWLSRQRKAHDLTQEELADRLGCSRWTIQKFEVGNRSPSRQMAELLADYFHVPTTEREAFLRLARGRTDEQAPHKSAIRTTQDHELGIEHPNNLPVQLTSFVGRDVELPRVRDLMLTSDVRLLTLTGPPGTGKTRLALRVGAELLRDFDSGVFFVSLAPVSDPGLVISEIAQTLVVGESQGKSLLESIGAYLRDKSLLLVLDNFEQIVEAGPSVAELLMKAPRLKILVTSRVPLHIRGEKEFSVPPLHLPNLEHLPPLERLSRYEAVRLFIQRATNVSADFEMTANNAYAVAHICARLDGLPLAIELAAARIKLFTPQAILARLQSRLKLLTAGAKDLPARQQTLRSAIEWSYNLLSDEEKKLFRRLAVFQGGCMLDAIEGVCDAGDDLQLDMLDTVQSLVDKNLLRQEVGAGGGGGGEPRFTMLETIHEFATEKLQESGESDELRREHALFFMRLAEEAESELKGARPQDWLDRLEDEHDNLRTAIDWSTQNADGPPAETMVAMETGLRLAGVLWRFWLTRGYWSEGRRQLAAVLAFGAVGIGRRDAKDEGRRPIEPVPATWATTLRGARAKALNGAGVLAWWQGDNATARSLHEESLAINRELGDKVGVANALHYLGIIAYTEDDYATARLLYDECLALRREMRDKWGIAVSLDALGGVANKQENYALAHALYKESLTIRRELGDKVGIANSLRNLGIMAYDIEDYALARPLLEESLTIARELKDKRSISHSTLALARLAHREGDAGQSKELFAQSIALLQGMGDWPRVAIWLAEVGGIAGEGNQPLKGARLLGASEAVLEAAGDAWRTHQGYNQKVSHVRSQLDEGAFEKAWQEGRAMSMEEAIAYALEE